MIAGVSPGIMPWTPSLLGMADSFPGLLFYLKSASFPEALFNQVSA